MIVLGLTGSLAMGKSTAAEMLRRLKIPVHDADAVVHQLLGPGGQAVAAVDSAFPGLRKNDAIDRQALGRRVFGDDEALDRLEALLHPLVRREEKKFVLRHQKAGRKLVVLDIPLLFETGAESRCSAVALVTAPAFLQRQRALARPGMTEEKFQAILARQIPDDVKRLMADFIVQTGLGRAWTLQRLREIVKALTEGN